MLGTQIVCRPTYSYTAVGWNKLLLVESYENLLITNLCHFFLGFPWKYITRHLKCEFAYIEINRFPDTYFQIYIILYSILLELLVYFITFRI